MLKDVGDGRRGCPIKSPAENKSPRKKRNRQPAANNMGRNSVPRFKVHVFHCLYSFSHKMEFCIKNNYVVDIICSGILLHCNNVRQRSCIFQQSIKHLK